MRQKIWILVLILANTSCSTKDKTDHELLDLDKKEMQENLDSYKVATYKFGKILIRSSVEKDTISAEFQAFKSDFDKLTKKLMSHDMGQSGNLSLLDYVSIYYDYKKMKKFVMITDEDDFPALTDAFNVTYGDPAELNYQYLSGQEKEYAQNMEHAVLSAMVILVKEFGKEVSLYECSKTKPGLLPDSEEKTLLQFLRGFIFFEKGFFYLSEDEISNNIKWLDNNKKVDMPYTRAVFEWGNLDNDRTHLGFHALNHLFRGIDRLMMEREVDEERALEDFEIFLKDSKEIGLDNEVIWSIEAFLYLKHEKNDEAVSALKKLKGSPLISSKEKMRLDESIEYVNDRKSGKVLNGFYDKYFLSKIATKYIFSILAQVDWEKVMKEQNVPHTAEMFKTVGRVKDFVSNLNKYTGTDQLKETGKDLKNKGGDLWNKAKEMVE